MLTGSKSISLALTSALLLVAASATAETLYTADLSGALAGTPSTGSGFAELVLNDEGTLVTYHIEYSGLSAPETIAHFHRGAPDEFGPVLLALSLGSPKDGTWAITPTQLTALQTGRVYVNIHSQSWPGGEIRGNFDFGTVAADHGSWGDLKALYQ